MATSGVIYTGYGDDSRFRVDWWIASQSIEGNYSSVSWKIYLDNGDYWYSNAVKINYLTINGSTVKGKQTFSNITTQGLVSLASGSTTIYHNSDGTANISLSFSGWLYATGTYPASGSAALTTIPRASSVTATAANIGSNPTFTIKRASSNFTHTLTYSFGGLTGTIATKTTATTINDWTVPTSFYSKIPNAKTGTATITIETYSGSTLIGTKTANLTVTASEALSKPLLSPTVADINPDTVALTNDSNVLIRYQSTARVTFGASARNSATLASKKMINGSNTLTADGAVTGVDTDSFTFEVRDSRGYITAKTVTKTIVQYINLSALIEAECISPDGVATLHVSGLFFDDTFGADGDRNTLNLNIQYRNITDDSAWMSAAVDMGDVTYYSDGRYRLTAYKSGLDYKKTYEFKVVATDRLTTATHTAPPIKGEPVFDWGKDDFNFNVDVNFSAEISGILDADTKALIAKLCE